MMRGFLCFHDTSIVSQHFGKNKNPQTPNLSICGILVTRTGIELNFSNFATLHDIEETV